MASMPPVYNRAPHDIWAAFRLGQSSQNAPGQYLPRSTPQDVSTPAFPPPAAGDAPLPGAAAQGSPAPAPGGFSLRPLADEVGRIVTDTFGGFGQPPAGGGDGRGPNPGGAPGAAGAMQAGAPDSPGRVPGGGGSDKVIDPPMFGSVPVGTEIEWDIDTPDRAWDRNRVLFEKTGLTSDGEAQYVAFLNANIGRGLTAQDVKTWLDSHGLPSDRGISLDGAAKQMMEEDFVKGKKMFGSFDFSAEQKAYEDALKTALTLFHAAVGNSPTTVNGAINYGGSQGVTLGGSDEIVGSAGAVTAALRGENPIEGYRLMRDLVRMGNQQAHEAHPIVYTGSEIIGSLVTPVPGLSEAKTVGGVAKTGALVSGIYGFNSGEGLGNSILGATTGTALGGITAPAVHGAIDTFAEPVATLIKKAAGKTRLPEAGERVAAGKALDVPISNAEVYVRANKQGLRERQFGDAKSVFEKADAVEDQAIQNSLRTHVGGPGMAVGDDALGNTLRTALDGLPQTGKTALGDLFDSTGRPVGGAQMAGTIRGWAQTDPGKLKLVLDTLAPAAKDQLRASLANNLGIDASGKFSLKQFLTAVIGDANTAPQIGRESQRLIFGRDGMQALGRLRMLAEGKLATRGGNGIAGQAAPGALQRGMRGVPKGLRTGFINVLGAVVGSHVFGEAGAAAGTISTSVLNNFVDKMGEQRIARLVTSPVVMKWAERMPEATDPRAIERYFEVLTKKAATNVVLQQDVAVLRDAMMETLAQPAPPASGPAGE